jgi:hypothetical protein
VISHCLSSRGPGPARQTLLHRVAHLIVQRADPRRMMLLTFSRRAAAEMSRRVERIAAQVLPEHGRLMVDALNLVQATEVLRCEDDSCSSRQPKEVIRLWSKHPSLVRPAGWEVPWRHRISPR